MRSVLLATRGASGGKSCGRAPSSVRPTASSGSARLATEATVATETELRQGLAAIGRYLTAHQLPQERALLRLDGQYGTGAVLSDLAGFAFVTRGKDYTVLDHPLVQARLHLPPDQFQQRPESQMVRSLYDCPEVPVGPEGVLCRVVVATHPAGKKKSPVGVTRAGVVYELFFTNLPQQAFTASDVVELYLHRGAFEPALADEDQEIDPDRWCSHTAWGQECWQVVSQWVWNLRLELGHQLGADPLRTTEFAPAIPPHQRAGCRLIRSCVWLWPTHHGHLPGKQDASLVKTFLSSPMGRCAVQQARSLSAQERRRELMAACVWCMRPAFAVAARVRCASSDNGRATPRPSRAREVACCIPLLWVSLLSFGVTGVGDNIGEHARSCTANAWNSRGSRICPPTQHSLRQRSLVPSARIIVSVGKSDWRGPARAATSGRITLKLFGIPEDVATSLGLAAA